MSAIGEGRKIEGRSPLLRLAEPLRRWGRALGDSLDATLFPTVCPICEAETLGPPICPDCRDEMLDASGINCPRCAMPVGPYTQTDGQCSECRGHSLGFDAALALGPYQGPIRDLCLRLKHQQHAWVGRWLEELLVASKGEALRAEIGSQANARPVIVAIPQHWRKRLEKSFYNQADILAQELSGLLDLPLARPMRRVKPTPRLADLSKTERARVLRGAFSAREGPVRGRLVLLVDDILTSGATCGAAARALKRAGAKRVVAVVIGRAEGNG